MADYTLSAKITGDSSGFEKAFSTAQKAADRFSAKMASVSKTITAIGDKMSAAGDKISGFGKKLTAVTASLGVAATAGIKYNGTVEQLQTSFEVMTGSAEKAADIVQRLQKIGAETPFEFTDLANTTNMLMQFGFTADDAIESMQMLGDISQGSAQKLDSIARAYGKMSSSCKVSLEDINMMIDAGFNPLQEISETTGESMASLYERISDGAMAVDEITASMQRSTSEGGKYFQSMEKQSQTFNGQMSTLSDNVQSFLGNVTSGIFERLAQDVLPKVNEAISKINDAFTAGGFQGMLDALKEMSPVLDTVISKFEQVGAVLDSVGISPQMFAGIIVGAGPALVVLGKVISVAGSVVSVFGKIGSAVSSLSPAFSAMIAPIMAVIGVITAIAGSFAYMTATSEGFRGQVMALVSSIQSSVQPAIELMQQTLSNIIATVLPVIQNVISQLVPVLAQIGLVIMQIVDALAPLIAQLMSSLMPVVENIITVVMNIVQAAMPAVIAIINAVMDVVNALIPVIQKVLSVVVSVVSKVMQVINPIISFIGEVIAAIMSIIAPIVEFIAEIITAIIDIISGIIDVVISVFSNVFNVVSGVFSSIVDFVGGAIDTIGSVISTIKDVFSNVFNTVYSIVSGIMSKVGSFISGVFDGIKSAWNGLTSFVSGVFEGIGSAVSTLVNTVKGFVNGVISGINAAIGLINMIPGVNIGKIPYLAHGTDNWQGGFAVMNEGGRGELTYLPNGAQVIPHDISVKYAKESARANAAAEPVQMNYGQFIADLKSAMSGITVRHETTLNGKVVAVELTPLISERMNRQYVADGRR